nr:kxDL motif-containing protein 1-like [Arachis hypogaea]
MMHKDSYVTSYREMLRLREELDNVWEDYSKLQSHLVGSVTVAYENLKEDGKIVSDDGDDDDEVDPLPVSSAKVSAPIVPSAKVDTPASDPDCQILNRDDGTVDAVPLQARPPSPQTDAAKKPSDL